MMHKKKNNHPVSTHHFCNSLLRGHQTSPQKREKPAGIAKGYQRADAGQYYADL